MIGSGPPPDPIYLLDILAHCPACGHEMLAIDADVDDDGLYCPECGERVDVEAPCGKGD